MIAQFVLTLCLATLFDFPGCASFEWQSAWVTVAPDPMADLVHQTMRADYRGQTDRLAKLATAFAADTSATPRGAYAHYWRGYALWRRAFNLFNDDTTSAPARADLRIASIEFDRAATHDPLRADALSARVSCLATLGATAGSTDSMWASVRVCSPLLKAAMVAGPDNPRVLWVRSMLLFYTPSPVGGPDTAMKVMERGILLARAPGICPADPLAPSWGEAENQMNLAWAASHAPVPDFERAERAALEALRLVPDWHYVKDILLPQIREARRAAAKRG